MTNRLDQIRRAEAESHMEAYTNHGLYEAGSWLAKPVKTVVDLLPAFDGCHSFRALDLGCGVGRNSIPVARHFAEVPCRVDCVDILPLAIEKLQENAKKFQVAGAIHGVLSAIDDYEIGEDCYDLVLAVSALEHAASEAVFARKLAQIRDGLREGGIACLIMNTGIREWDKATGGELPPQFEVNLPTGELDRVMEQVFAGWETIKHTVVHQKYEIPRENGAAQLETDVVTWVVRRNYGNNLRAE